MRIRIAGCEWPALQTTPITEVYVELTVSPAQFNAFHMDSVRMRMGCTAINEFKADVFWSTEPAFTSSTQITNATGLTNNYLPRDDLYQLAVSLDVPVGDGETFYLRIYPHNTAAENQAKMPVLHAVTLYGLVLGVTADPPVVSTDPVTYVSTSFATGSGSMVTDGGAPITERGVVWNDSGSPTTDDSKTESGTGSGSFSGQMTGLSPGTLYYVRAYATNFAGTSYGQEIQFTSLVSVVVPTLTTSAVSNVLVKTALSGGEVTDWGGDTIEARGVCWNTTGSPTLADDQSIDGKGIGTFSSTMIQLSETTTYYVRAYATNSAGTGYGNEVSFTTQAAAPDVTRIVARDGSGDYTTVQAAFDAVPDLYTGNYTIYVKPGKYYEKLQLGNNQVNVILRGDNPDSVILTYDDYAGKVGGTSGSYSVSIEADDFRTYNVTFQNTIISDGSFSGQQAVALRTNGARQSYYNCRILGTQDTYYAYGGGGTDRIYMKNSLIEGSVDFIFGRDIVVFDSCEIRINRNGGTLTAAATEAESAFGLVFRDCRITTTGVGFDGVTISRFVLGRPWQQAPRTVFLRCEEPASLSSSGWSTWNVTPALYAEYDCSGPGSGTAGRISISRHLSSKEAEGYSLRNIFARSSNPLFGYDWVPDSTVRKYDQELLNFGDLPAKTYGNDSFTPDAEASSGLPVSFTSSDQDVATTSGTRVQISGVGTAEITARQEGNYLYYPSGSMTKTLDVSRAELTATADDISRPFGSPNPVLTISYTGFAYGDSERDITPPDISCEADEQRPIGTYPIVLSGGAADNYNLTLVNGTLSVTDASGTGDLHREGALRIYPNPASGMISIERKSGQPGSMLIFDLRNRVLIECILGDDLQTVDVSRLPGGIYLMRVGDRVIPFVKR